MSFSFRARARASVFVALAVTLTTTVVVGSRAAHAASPPVAVMYGNTLGWESSPTIETLAARKTTVKIVPHAFPNTGLCYWNAWLPADLAEFHPALVGVNGMSNPVNAADPTCGTGPDGAVPAIGSPEYLTAWTDALRTFFTLATDGGARVVYFATPPVKDPVRNAAYTKQNAIAKQLAGTFHGISYSGSIRTTLSLNGAYTDVKKCLTTETAAMGCGADLRIPVRTLTAPFQAGSHLCPAGLPDAVPWLCATYSSGEFRYAKAVVSTLVRPPRPILP